MVSLPYSVTFSFVNRYFAPWAVKTGQSPSLPTHSRHRAARPAPVLTSPYPRYVYVALLAVHTTLHSSAKSLCYFHARFRPFLAADDPEHSSTKGLSIHQPSLLAGNDTLHSSAVSRGSRSIVYCSWISLWDGLVMGGDYVLHWVLYTSVM